MTMTKSKEEMAVAVCAGPLGLEGDPMTASMEASRPKGVNLDELTAAVGQLAKVYQSSDADEMEIDSAGFHLRLAKHAPQSAPVVMSAVAPALAQAPASAAAATCQPEATVTPFAAAAPAGATDQAVQDEAEDSDLTQVKAPLVGVFYAAPAPDAEPFVVEGQKVAKGDVLCIIEAMKFMNEICASCDGVVESIVAENGKPVAFDELLMTIRS